jgi:exosortase C (VPDSG-CTERM-specific)
MISRFVNKRSVPQSAASDSDQISGSSRLRLLMFAGFTLLLTAFFFSPLRSLVVHALHNDLDSHTILVPIISAYLLYIRRAQLPNTYSCSPKLAIPPFVGGIALLLIPLAWRSYATLSNGDSLTFTTLSFVCFLVAGGFVFLGKDWMRVAAFPAAFLVFMVPLPEGAVSWLENASKLASAESASFLFRLTGMPVLRDGTIFQLPGIVIEVAEECSGIRSSWILLIASVLSAYLFLGRFSNRLILVSAAIPLGILRNGFRIVVIGLLCVHYGPHMIHSPIHRRGGPLFFAISLIPLFLLLFLLRRKEGVQQQRKESRKKLSGHQSETFTHHR